MSNQRAARTGGCKTEGLRGVNREEHVKIRELTCDRVENADGTKGKHKLHRVCRTKSGTLGNY